MLKQEFEFAFAWEMWILRAAAKSTFNFDGFKILNKGVVVQGYLIF